MAEYWKSAPPDAAKREAEAEYVELTRRASAHVERGEKVPDDLLRQVREAARRAGATAN